MTGAAVGVNPWITLDSASVASRADLEDWFSFFDFGDLPVSLSTQEADGDARLSDIYSSDLLPPLPPFLGFGSDCEREGSDPFDVQICSNFSPENVLTGALESADGDFFLLPSKIPSSSTFSLNNSDAGSCAAVREPVSVSEEKLDNREREFLSPLSAMKDRLNCSGASSRKRRHEDSGSDMDGGDKESNLDAVPMDKRQQRLLRNRELAYESRQRKKSYVSELEARCRVLEQDCNQLQQQLCLVSTENSVLKGELSRVKSVKQGKHRVTEPAVLFTDSLPLEFLLLLVCLLLIAVLSPCDSPSLGLALKLSFLQSTIKRGELGKEQLVANDKWPKFMLNGVQWLLKYHTPFFLYGFCCTIMAWQVWLMYWKHYSLMSM